MSYTCTTKYIEDRDECDALLMEIEGYVGNVIDDKSIAA